MSMVVKDTSIFENDPPLFINQIKKFISSMSFPPLLLMDGTFGRGGHSRSLLESFCRLKILALDRDLEAVQWGEKMFLDEVKRGRIQFCHADFVHFLLNFKEYSWLRFQTDNMTWKGKRGEKQESQTQKEERITSFDGILLDLGPSLYQLNEFHRGFSFYTKGPLDMRMDLRQKFKASDIVNTWRESALVSLFQKYGDIKKPHKTVKALLHQRKKKEFETTEELSSFIAKQEKWLRKGHHPATRFFLALRIKVNEELEQIKTSLPGFLELLSPGGLFFIVSFHSIEDKIVKYLFREFEEKKEGVILTKKVIQASWKEKQAQPRIRSAKLRVFQKSVKKSALK